MRRAEQERIDKEKRQKAFEEKKVEEMRRAEQEQIDKEKRQSAFEETCRARKRRFDRGCAEAREMRQERYARNRRKRAPMTRVHRKSDECKEGMKLIEEIRAFVRENFVFDKFKKLLVCDMLELFIKSRDHISILEINLFKRHSKRLILEALPRVLYTANTNKRCFLHVGIKQ
jgi:hypothetical protein